MSSDDSKTKVMVAGSKNRAGIGQSVTDPYWIVIADDELRAAVKRIPNIATSRFFNRVNLHLPSVKAEMHKLASHNRIMFIVLIGTRDSGYAIPCWLIIPLIIAGTHD